jgi:hypothetical protein
MIWATCGSLSAQPLIVRDYLLPCSPQHLIRRGTVTPLLQKRRFAPRILRAAPKQVR